MTNSLILAAGAVLLVSIVILARVPGRLAAVCLALIVYLNLVNYSELREGIGSLITGFRVVVLVFGIVYLAARRRTAVTRLFRHWDVLLLGAVSVVSGFVGGSPEAIFYGLWFSAALVFILLYVDSFSNPTLLLNATLTVFTLAFLLPVIAASAVLPQYVVGQRLRTPFNLKEVNAFASVVVVSAGTIWLTVRGVAVRSRVKRWLLLSVLVLCVLNIVLSGVRSAFIAIALTVVMPLLCWRWLNSTSSASMRTTIRWVVGGGLVVLCAYLALVNLGSGTLIANRIQKTESEGISQSNLRVLIWEGGIQQFSESPVFGVGLAQARVILPMHLDWQEGELVFALHSTYLEVLVELGVAGCLAGLVVVLRSIRFAKQLRACLGVSMIFGIGLAVIAAFESNLTPGQILFYPVAFSLLMCRSSVWQVRRGVQVRAGATYSMHAVPAVAQLRPTLGCGIGLTTFAGGVGGGARGAVRAKWQVGE